MPQAIAETVFDIFYLGFAVIAGFTMLIKGKTPLVRKAGVMAALLGVGDSFHLIPRSYGLWTTCLEANAALLGIGKFVTSITITIFYLILYLFFYLISFLIFYLIFLSDRYSFFSYYQFSSLIQYPTPRTV